MIATAASTAAWHLFYAMLLGLFLVLGYGLARRLGAEAAATWCKELFRALSHTLASICSGDSHHSFSAQCGARAGASWRWAVAEWTVDLVLGAGHCERAAEREGLIPKH